MSATQPNFLRTIITTTNKREFQTNQDDKLLEWLSDRTAKRLQQELETCIKHADGHFESLLETSNGRTYKKENLHFGFSPDSLLLKDGFNALLRILDCRTGDIMTAHQPPPNTASLPGDPFPPHFTPEDLGLIHFQKSARSSIVDLKSLSLKMAGEQKKDLDKKIGWLEAGLLVAEHTGPMEIMQAAEAFHIATNAGVKK